MSLVNQYIETMENKDYEGLANLFTQEGTINDFCPKGTGSDSYHVYGREAINMFFRNRFTFGRFSISKAVPIDGRHVDFVASYDGYMVMARAALDISEDGKSIRGVQIRPR